MNRFPVEFTIDNDTRVVVNKTGPHLYDFYLNPVTGAPRHFTYNHKETKAEVDKSLDFEQLNAIRTFWLKYDDEA